MDKQIYSIFSMSDNKMFKLINFSPIGFKVMHYPTKYCPLCRGLLNEFCGKCVENNSDICNVVCIDETYYHSHCHGLMDDTPPHQIIN